MDVTVGYSGGNTENPTYESVCSDSTMHAEANRIKYDDEVISYRDLVLYFFGMHDPSTPNKQGVDIGTQYRSMIFYTDESEKDIAKDIIDKLNQTKYIFSKIVTEVVPFEVFYEAEDYHQNYYQKKGMTARKPVKEFT